MKAFLMYKDRDFDLRRKLPWNEQDLTQDLELDTLFNAMALQDKFLFDVARRAILSGWRNDLDTIRYRQAILKDCLQNPAIVREIYAIAVESIESEKKNYWGIFSKYPAAILRRSIEVLEMFVSMLKKLRSIADEQAARFESEGFTRLFAMLRQELADEYFASIEDHLQMLAFRDGILISAELGKGNKGTNYVLRKLQAEKQSWLQRVFADNSTAYSFRISERDASGGEPVGTERQRNPPGCQCARPVYGSYAQFFYPAADRISLLHGLFESTYATNPNGRATMLPRAGGSRRMQTCFSGIIRCLSGFEHATKSCG